MRRTLLFALGGLLIGGIVHVAIVFLVPFYAGKDAWAQIARFGADGQFHTLAMAESGNEPIVGLDPKMMVAVCRFSLANGPLRVRADLPDEFWSAAVFDRRGRNVYSLNDRAAEKSHLDLAIMTPVQLAQLRQNPPPALETAIVLELPIQTGFVLLRAFVPDESMLPGTTASLHGADCGGSLD